jgi:hypothetical protein
MKAGVTHPGLLAFHRAGKATVIRLRNFATVAQSDEMQLFK